MSIFWSRVFVKENVLLCLAADIPSGSVADVGDIHELEIGGITNFHYNKTRPCSKSTLYPVKYRIYPSSCSVINRQLLDYLRY